MACLHACAGTLASLARAPPLPTLAPQPPHACWHAGGGRSPNSRQARQHASQAAFTSSSSSSSNLGVLQSVVEQRPSQADDPYAMQRVSPDSFAGTTFSPDGSTIFGSLVLLVVLLALSLERILGLDRFVTQALKNWRDARQYDRRNEVIKARQVLEDSWDGDEEEDGGPART